MARNLCNIGCAACNGTVVKTGPNRIATEADVHAYFPEYGGMIIADAECQDCGAKYMAWVAAGTSKLPRMWAADNDSGPGIALSTFFDLSYRQSFNDEPGPDDLPLRCPMHCAMRLLADALYEVCCALPGEVWWKWHQACSSSR